MIKFWQNVLLMAMICATICYCVTQMAGCDARKPSHRIIQVNQ